MSSAVLQVPLSESLSDFIAEKVNSGEFSTAEECVRSILEAAREREEQSRLEEMLLEGIDSGAGPTMDDAWLQEKKNRLLANYPELQDELP